MGLEPYKHTLFVATLTLTLLLPQELKLSKRRLVNVAFLAHVVHRNLFCSLHTLDLSRNLIVTLHGQGLGLLPSLRSLDLSNNSLGSLSEAINELQLCANLRILKLKHATGRR